MVTCLQAHLTSVPKPDRGAYPLAEVNLGKLLAMCQHHEVTPLVYQTLRTLNLGEGVLEPFKLEVVNETRWAFGLTKQVVILLRHFKGEGVPLLMHKGVVLSQRLFSDVALRPTKDIDIIVSAADYPRAKQCLAGLGYTGPFAYSGRLLDEAWEAFYLDKLHHVEFHHPDGATVELHWRLSPDFRNDQSETLLWNSVGQGTFFGTPILCFDEPFLFNVLCEHGAGHHWFRLKWLFDVAVLSDRAKGAAKQTGREQLSEHLPNQIGSVYVLCHRLFNLGPPSTFSATVDQLWIAEQVIQQFRTFPITHITGARRYRYQLHMLNSRHPWLAWKMFKHFFFDHDRIHQHVAGWPSHLRSLARLTWRALRR